jgi:hypothetical protein
LRNNSGYRQYFLLLILILIGFLIRLYFQIGHVFSDDAYYSYLSHSLLNGGFTTNFLGYPVFPLRIGFISLTSISMMIFGTNEFSTLIFPFLFSILNIVLTFNLSQLITKNINISLISAFLIAFFPTDIIFASIGFPDLINVFFINLGIYFLLKSYFQKKMIWSYAGGFAFFLSMQFKETIYYVFILLIILSVYQLIKNKQLNFQLLVGLLFILANYLIEGFAYLLLHNDFFYRITITNINYHFSYYDFFPYTAQKISGSNNYLRNLVDQIFLINAKSVFLRRFYLFLPLISIIQSYFSFKNKDHKLLIFWFWGTVILIIAFTTSFTEYKPLDLARSWYIFPLLMPIIILASIFINRFSKYIKTLLLIIYSIGSLIMCFEYQTFFDSNNLNQLKKFLRENSTKEIYTDHFTKYSVDLIRSYNGDYSDRILGKDFELGEISSGSWVLYNKEHIDELKLQHFEYPDFSVLESSEFKLVASFKDFIFYEKLP